MSLCDHSHNRRQFKSGPRYQLFRKPEVSILILKPQAFAF